jgi:hypothetical protein
VLTAAYGPLSGAEKLKFLRLRLALQRSALGFFPVTVAASAPTLDDSLYTMLNSSYFNEA